MEKILFFNEGEYIKEISALINTWQAQPYVDNEEAIRQFKEACNIIKFLIHGDALFASNINETLHGMGNISFCGKNMSCSMTMPLAEIINRASVVDITPKLDGAVECTLGFYGLAHSVDDTEPEPKKITPVVPAIGQEIAVAKMLVDDADGNIDYNNSHKLRLTMGTSILDSDELKRGFCSLISAYNNINFVEVDQDNWRLVLTR